MQNRITIWQMKGAEIPRNWSWVSQLITPSIQRDPDRTMQSVYDDILHERIAIATVHHESGGAAVLLMQGVEQADGLDIWILALSGQIGGGKTFLTAVRDGVAEIVKRAKDLGCHAVCMCGRDWRYALPDFEEFETKWPYSIRKVLN